jgi:glutamate dehydrogenase/leucine dehydrogenase
LTPGLFDALRDLKYERLVVVDKKGAVVLAAARPDEDERELSATEDAELLAAAAPLLDAFAAAEDVRRIECSYRRDVGLRLVHVRRRDALLRAIGPVRRVDLAKPETQVFREACVAARAAAFAAAACDIPRGGAAVFLHATPAPEHDRARFAEALAEELMLYGVDGFWDAGLALDWAKDAAKRGAPLFGLSAPTSGDVAAFGAAATARAALAAVGPRAGDEPSVFVVQGLGKVGGALARTLASEGRRLVVSDKDYPRIDALLGSLGPEERKNTGVVAPYQVMEILAKPNGCDVFCPAAEGGVLKLESLKKLRCRAIAGPATGVFDVASRADEEAVARAAYERNIVYVPDWLSGVGGVARAWFEAEARGGPFDPRAVEARVERVAGWLADDAIGEAKRTGRPTLDVLRAKIASAYSTARDR